MDNMQIKVFNPDEDYEEIKTWFERHKKIVPNKDMLSRNGVIVSGVACGFLYVTDSSLAFLDFYVSNPFSDSDKRHRALEMITMNLMMWAKEMGASHLMANSQVKTIQSLAINSGFKSLGVTHAYVKEL